VARGNQQGAGRLKRGKIGGVGFEQKSISGNGAKSEVKFFSRGIEDIGREGEVSAEADEFGDDVGGAAKGVEEETRGERFLLAEDFFERLPGAEAMNHGGPMEASSEFELVYERLLLIGFVAGFFPMVQTDLADGGGDFVEEGFELDEPVVGPGREIPGVCAEAGDNGRVLKSDISDKRPILGGGSVTEEKRNSGVASALEDGGLVL